MTHDELALDLAESLRGGNRMVWTDMQLGPAGSPRPDVYTVPYSYSRFTPLAYECKISVADFRSDVTSGKWQSYLKFASGVFFAVPQGLVSKAEIPPTAGLIVRCGKVWRTAKAPSLQPGPELSRDAWMKLLIDGTERSHAKLRLLDASAWKLARSTRQRLSEDVLLAVSDLAAARGQIALAEERAKNILADARRQSVRDTAAISEELRELHNVRASLCASLGIPETEEASLYQLKNRAAELLNPVKALAESTRWHLEMLQKRLTEFSETTS